MDYNVPHGQQFVMYNPVTGDSTFRTVFHSTRQLFGEVKNSRGFIFNELSVIMREWIDGFGPKPIGTIIQCLQVNGGDTTYHDYGYEPDFSYFQPILKTSNFDFDYIFTVFHHYDYLYSNFMDEVYLDCYYKSDIETIYAGRLFADVFDETGRKKVHITLNPNLIKNGYVFNYKVTGKDNSLIPKYKSKPDTGYYQLIYDPSPAQVLFSQDSIYIPTLSDSGSVKIINTSDHSVRIDSIISVGSFYGYWGNFTKPGFEYPFYLFQTMPGFMGDTLGIIILPHDSINVSFSNVDLCPVCDYEVQEYFKDTLRFVFTFMDGNVYSFSKTIPISGEGHPSDVEDDEVLPKEFSLSQNYPNPFNPSTSIHYAIGSREFVTLKIYDVLGNEVAVFVNEEKSSGSYEINFDANKLASGVYYYQLKAGDFIQTKKMIYLK